MLYIKVPKKNIYVFNLYANGNIIEFSKNEYFTYFKMSGVAILQYKYPKHRRLYIVRNSDELKYYPKMYLPNVKNKVGVIYFICGGRRIDLLRQAIYNLEEIGGKQIYNYPTIFWQEFSCLLDDFNGYKSSATKTNLILLLNKYKNCKKALEND